MMKLYFDGYGGFPAGSVIIGSERHILKGQADSSGWTDVKQNTKKAIAYTFMNMPVTFDNLKTARASMNR